MRREVVRTMEGWNELKSDWNDLLARSSSDALFLTWEWLDTWLAIHGPLSSLFVICIRGSGGKLVGLAPYYKTNYALLRLFPYTVLRTIGDVDSGAEYQTWIADRDDEPVIFAEIAAALRELRSEWDLIWMPKLAAWSPTSGSVVAAMRANSLAVNCRPIPFSAISLPNEFDTFLDRMSANRRQQVRRMARKVLSRPGVDIRKVVTADDLPFALDALFRLHTKRWQAVGHGGVFGPAKKERAFYEQFVPKALDRGWLAMYVLTDRGEPKAVQIGYVYNLMFLQLQEGFDTDYAPHVGNTLRAHVIEQCINNGLREYDFLGGFSAHKQHWLAETRSGMDLLAGPRRAKNLPILWGGVWPTGRYLRPVG